MASNKIAKSAGSAPANDIELQVAQALYDLETNVAELKKDLRPLQISTAKEVDLSGGKKAIVIFVPVPLLKSFHKIQQRLTRELEKKFSPNATSSSSLSAESCASLLATRGKSRLVLVRAP